MVATVGVGLKWIRARVGMWYIGRELENAEGLG